MRAHDIDKNVLDAATYDNAEGINLILEGVAKAAAIEEEAASS